MYFLGGGKLMQYQKVIVFIMNGILVNSLTYPEQHKLLKNPVPQAVRRTPRHRRHRARDREPTYSATFPRDLFQCMTGPGRFASLSARRNDKCAHLRTQMGWFASLCARTRRFGAHLRTQNGPTRGNVRAHHSAVRRDSADQASKKPD